MWVMSQKWAILNDYRFKIRIPRHLRDKTETSEELQWAATLSSGCNSSWDHVEMFKSKPISGSMRFKPCTNYHIYIYTYRVISP